MTESEWHHCFDPQVMLAFLRDAGRLSDRKARLFGVACCRRIWPLLTDERSRRAVEVAERFADGLATGEELGAAAQATRETAVVRIAFRDSALPTPAYWVSYTRFFTADAVRLTADGDGTAATQAAHAAASDRAAKASVRGVEGVHHLVHSVLAVELPAQCHLLRCLFGSPLRPAPALEPRLLTPGIVALAQTIYDHRVFGLLPDLARMLEAAGCTDAELLGHLRSPGPHVRGCFALDAVLQRT